MIDLHNHVLFGLDDGCRTPEESRALASSMKAAGHVRVVATPHIRPGIFDNTPDSIRRRFEEARVELAGSGLELSLGAEYYFDPSLLGAVRQKSLLTLGETTHFFLTELPQTQLPPRLFDLIFEIRLAGYVPVIAHPERCRGVQDNVKGVLERFRQVRAPLQLDVGSLIGFYGAPARKAALELLKLGAYTVASCDLHRPEDVPEVVTRGLEALALLLGKRKIADGFERLTRTNPRLILENAPVERVLPV